MIRLNSVRIFVIHHMLHLINRNKYIRVSIHSYVILNEVPKFHRCKQVSIDLDL